MKEGLPTTISALDYVQERAGEGCFAGQPSALMVLHYLAMNAWITPGPGRVVGEVMSGRSSLQSIEKHTALSRSTVQRALTWLGEREWIDSERQADSRGGEANRFILVKLKAGERQRVDIGAQKGVSP